MISFGMCAGGPAGASLHLGAGPSQNSPARAKAAWRLGGGEIGQGTKREICMGAAHSILIAWIKSLPLQVLCKA